MKDCGSIVLILITYRRGTPLPPFPKPTHGPLGSGLKKFHTIRDALLPIERLGNRPTGDQYHQPKILKKPKEPYDPRGFLRGCITAGGGVNYHPSGLRNFTPRELGLLQSFPVTYKFCGTQTEAVKQIGNAFPPIMAEAMFRTIAKTLEAFDKGYIHAEDDIDDIDSISERKGVRLEAPLAAPRSIFNTPYYRPSSMSSRYLVRDERSRVGQAAPAYSSPFARNHLQTSASQPSRATARSTYQESNFLDGLLIDLDEDSDPDEVCESIETRPGRRAPQIIRDASSDVIEISSESESESDEDEEEEEDREWVHVQR